MGAISIFHFAAPRLEPFISYILFSLPNDCKVPLLTIG